MNVRDFDLVGYKYSLLSTIGTAGLNNVVTMIPARDEEEFALFPGDDIAFIRKWLTWTDVHMDALRNTMPISSLPPPRLGSVDGTASWSDRGQGFLFLYNPNPLPMRITLTADETIGVANESSHSAWQVAQLYPWEAAPFFTWEHGESCELSVGGSDVLVLQLTPAAARTVVAEHSFSDAPIVVRSAPVGDVPPRNNTGGAFSTTFVVSEAVKKQLAARAVAYPINWTFPTDYNATWLVPTRLLAYVFIASPRDTMEVSMVVDGTAVPLTKAYNSRGRTPRPEGAFLAFMLTFPYFCATPRVQSTRWRLQFRLVCPRGRFKAYSMKIWKQNTKRSLFVRLSLVHDGRHDGRALYYFMHPYLYTYIAYLFYSYDVFILCAKDATTPSTAICYWRSQKMTARSYRKKSLGRRLWRCLRLCLQPCPRRTTRSPSLSW